MEMIPYYVMHPALGVTAVVHAPSTEKARTTFLDWLERNGNMRRMDRQQLRKDMVAKRLEDSNVQSDVVLHYGYQDVGVHYPAGPGGTFGEAAGSPSEETPREPWEEDMPAPRQLAPLELPEVEKEEPRMPIQKIMLRGFS
jgi:hypothetical protein